ncbi:MAG TPA: N-6 DNA methylase [Pyrinomonadaceae bacterium]|jgi:adenine-specific DNA methylase|nr:N-6 DNA methylase [Pyrinomonadaceae bacterium]
MSRSAAKLIGQFYSPLDVVSALVSWLQPQSDERLLDPSCGDGRFISRHEFSMGIDVSAESCAEAQIRAPRAKILQANFFSWAAQTQERFECIAGNPPFIRYQNFAGNLRQEALSLSATQGAKFSGLTSSWAPFLVVASKLLKHNGRMAFIVPAEIGHATYAAPLLRSLTEHFERVLIVAVKDKIFPDLSADTWLLYADGYGGKAQFVEFAVWDKFRPTLPSPQETKKITLTSLRLHGMRLRKFILPDEILEYYAKLSEKPYVVDFGSVAHVGIGYVTGANDFFHLRPSEVASLRIPKSLLKVSVRKGEQLPNCAVDDNVVQAWLDDDQPVLLLDLSATTSIPRTVRQYLDSKAGRLAQRTYKCRNRSPWYAVPDVNTPDAFLSYMSGEKPNLVKNPAGCVCSNSVHAVRLRNGVLIDDLLMAWDHPLSNLSKEVEGHPLGGGLLKLEPREASRILLVINGKTKRSFDYELLQRGVNILRTWRHCAKPLTEVPTS